MRTRTKKLLALMLAVGMGMHVSPVYTGPWTLKKGQFQSSLTTTIYSMHKFFGQQKRILPTDKFQQTDLQLFMEYGLVDDFTIGTNPTYRWASVDHPAQRLTNNALIDTEIWGRYRLYTSGNHVVSAQGLVSVPGTYTAKRDPILGYKQSDIEARMLYGYSNSTTVIPWFFGIELARRWRMKGPADETRVDGTLGFNVTKQVIFVLQSFNTIGQRNAKVSINSPLNPPDYDLYKARASFIWSATDTIKLQAGYEKDLRGRNVGYGHAFVFGVGLTI